MPSINPGDNGSATSTAHAATINHTGGKITTESLTTAAGSDYTMNVTNACVNANSNVMASVANGDNSAGIPIVTTVTPGDGTVDIKVHNGHASAAFNGTLVISFVVL